MLGPPEVLVNSLKLHTDTRKAVALLAYLCLRDTAPDRDTLVELLWTGSEPERGHGALRRTLSTLKAALGGRWVVADRQRVRLERTGLALDLDRLQDDPESAAKVARGRFMDGFWLRDAPAFEEWHAATAERYDRVVKQVLARAAEAALARGDPAGTALAERMVALDQLDEAAHRLLMRAHAAVGDRASATRQFRKCVAVLGAELAVEPLPETVALHEAIMRGETVGAPRTPGHRLGKPPRAPFVGREGEVQALRQAVSRPGTVWLVGPPGSGRSRLLSEALPDAVRVAPQARAEQEPHSLTRSLLGLLLGDRSAPLGEAAAAAAHLHTGVAALVHDVPELTGKLGGAQLLAGVAAAVAELARGRMIAVDDADRADTASLEGLRYLAEHAMELGVHLVLVRSEVSWPSHRAAGLSDLIRLGPLPHDAILELLAGTHLDASQVIGATGRWPGPVVELLTAPSPELAIDRLRDRKLVRLEPLTRQVAEALAVLGTTDLPTLAVVAGRGREETAGAVDLLVDEGMARADANIEPTEWVAEAVLGAMGPARRALLHGRAAEALAGSGAHHDSAVAYHLERAGRLKEAGEAHERAARAAARVHANESVRAHVSAALAAGRTHAGPLHRLLGDVERSDGNYRQAVAAYHAAAGFGTDVALERAIGDVYRRWGRWDLALSAFEAAAAIAEPDELPPVLADRADVALRAGDRAAAELLIGRALEAGGAEMARVRNVAGMILDDSGHLAAAVSLARRSGEREVEAAALNNLALLQLREGQGTLALESAKRSLALLDRSGDRHRRAAVHGNLADILHALGDETLSREHLRTAVQLFAEVGIDDPDGWEPAVWSLTGW